FRALTARRFTEMRPSTWTPYSPALRAWCATRALATRVLVGVQPVLTQVPPNRRRSTIATLMPAAVSRPVKEGPAWPAPMTMASNDLFKAHTPDTGASAVMPGCVSVFLAGLELAGTPGDALQHFF